MSHLGPEQAWIMFASLSPLEVLQLWFYVCWYEYLGPEFPVPPLELCACIVWGTDVVYGGLLMGVGLWRLVWFAGCWPTRWGFPPIGPVGRTVGGGIGEGRIPQCWRPWYFWSWEGNISSSGSVPELVPRSILSWHVLPKCASLPLCHVSQSCILGVCWILFLYYARRMPVTDGPLPDHAI